MKVLIVLLYCLAICLMLVGAIPLLWGVGVPLYELAKHGRIDDIGLPWAVVIAGWGLAMFVPGLLLFLFSKLLEKSINQNSQAQLPHQT